MKRLFLIIIIMSMGIHLLKGQNNSQWQSWIYEKSANEFVSVGDYLWIRSNNNGLLRFNKITHEKYYFNTSNSDIPSNSFELIRADSQGRIWFDANGLTCFNGSDWINYSIESNHFPECIIRDFDFTDDGSLWVASSIGLIHFFPDSSTWDLFNNENVYFPDEGHPYYNGKLFSVCINNNNVVYGLTFKHLLKYENNQWTFTSLFDLTGIECWASCLFVDNNNVLWIGTQYGGLIRIMNENVTVYNDINSPIIGDWIGCITSDESNNLWVGAWNDSMLCYGGVSKFDGVNWQNYINNGAFLQELNYNIVRSINIQSNSGWAGTSRGLNFLALSQQMVDF